MYGKIAAAFTEAAQAVLQAETQVKLTRGEMELSENPFTTGEVTIIISLVGGVKGTVLYSLSEAMALALTSRLMGEPMDKFNSLAQSGIAELGNVITGQATVRLAQSGYEVTISPPTLLTGRDTVLSTLDLPRLVIPLASELGPFTLHLAMREADSLPPGTRPLAGPPTPA